MRVKPKDIILTLKRSGFSVDKTAKTLGIHRTTVWRWKRKATVRPGVLSSKNLRRKSTRPKNIKYKLTNKQRVDIESLRKNKGYDAAKIKVKLSLDVSISTIHRYLVKKSLAREYGNHRRPRFQNTKHMHAKNTKTIGYLQMDVKYITPELSGLPWTCFEYAVIDIFSRYKEAVILNQLDQDGSISALYQIIPRLPFKPIFLQTDNGLEFQKRFKKAVRDMGIDYHYIHKNTPNENALIERSFRTDEEEFFFMLEKRPKHYDELRELFSEFLHEYNHERPHHGIELKTPYEVVQSMLQMS